MKYLLMIDAKDSSMFNYYGKLRYDILFKINFGSPKKKEKNILIKRIFLKCIYIFESLKCIQKK